jgi:hypothetical protein
MDAQAIYSLSTAKLECLAAIRSSRFNVRYRPILLKKSGDNLQQAIVDA